MDHYCPAKELVALGASDIYSGHWHVAGEYKIDGIPVTCTGSMQPMTHAEDPKDLMYITLSLEEYETSNPKLFKDKYVRVIAEDGQEVEMPEDCLGFKIKRVSTSGEEIDETVEIEDFKVSDIIDANLKKHEVPEDVGLFIKDRIDAND